MLRKYRAPTHALNVERNYPFFAATGMCQLLEGSAVPHTSLPWRSVGTLHVCHSLGKQEPECPFAPPPFAFLLSYTSSCSCKLTLLREELEGCHGGQLESSEGCDSWLWERDENWGKMKCSYFNKDMCKLQFRRARGSAAVLWVISPEGFGKYFSLLAQKC